MIRPPPTSPLFPYPPLSRSGRGRKPPRPRRRNLSKRGNPPPRLPLVLRAEDCAWPGPRVDHARAAHLLSCTHGDRHHLLMRDTLAGRLPRGTCIGAPPQPLIDGAAVDVLLVQWINTQALRLVARQFK